VRCCAAAHAAELLRQSLQASKVAIGVGVLKRVAAKVRGSFAWSELIAVAVSLSTNFIYMTTSLYEKVI